MPKKPDWRPRLIADVDEVLYNRVKNNIPWGMFTAVLSNIMNELCDKIEKEGAIVAYLVANNKLSLFNGIKELDFLPDKKGPDLNGSR